MIPDYQSLMLPLLKYIRDGKIHTTQDAIAIIAKQFKLNENDLNEWLPSKKQKTFHNRVYWAKAHLKMAGVIENFGRGEFKITNRGIKILKEDPAFINVKYLTNKFEGALAGQGAKKEIDITTSSFTKEAKLYTPKNETKIVLIDGEKLSQYMICLLYTSPSPRDGLLSRMPSSA